MNMLPPKMKLLAVIVMVMVGQTVGTEGRGGSGTGNYRSPSSNFETERLSETIFEDGKSNTYEGGANSFTSSRSAPPRRFSKEFSQHEVPQPYNYQSAHEQGNTHYHRAKADPSGVVRGSYGYTDIQDLYRVVDYTADVSGFGTSIRANDPGIDSNESPEDVQKIIKQLPFGILDRYHPFGGRGFDDKRRDRKCCCKNFQVGNKIQ